MQTNNTPHMINESYALQVLQENHRALNGEPITLREYVETEASSDPSFFRWLFGELEQDFDTSLTPEQRAQYENFLNSLSTLRNTMQTVKFTNDNRNRIEAKGFESIQEAESAVDSFLEEQGDEYGRDATGFEDEDGNYYFRVTTTNSQ